MTLPAGWTICPLGELGEVKLGKMLDRSKNSGKPTAYLRNINVRWFKFDLSDIGMMLVSDEELNSLSVEDGDVFVCEGGEPGRCAVWGSGSARLVFQKALHRFRSYGAVIPRYVMYRLRHDAETGSLNSAFTGTTIKHLTRESLLRYAIPLAPLGEQTRIADKLEALLARVDACRARLDRVPALLKRFRQAVTETAVDGTLTEGWRETARRAKSWSTGTMADLFDGKPRNGYSPTSVDRVTPVRSLTLTATTSGRFSADHYKYIGEPIPADSHLWLQPGDILIQRANTLEYVGTSALYEGPPSAFIYPDLMMKARAGRSVSPQFLVLLLKSLAVRSHFRANATGTAGNMPKINQQIVLSAPARWPERDEQAEIVRRVESLFALADDLEARYKAARAHVDRLTPTLLAKAFRGELVPQDPNDEPADALLARLRSGAAKSEGDDSKTGKRGRGVRATRPPARSSGAMSTSQPVLSEKRAIFRT